MSIVYFLAALIKPTKVLDSSLLQLIMASITAALAGYHLSRKHMRKIKRKLFFGLLKQQFKNLFHRKVGVIGWPFIFQFLFWLALILLVTGLLVWSPLWGGLLILLGLFIYIRYMAKKYK